jgi:hypothetical protein
MSTWKLEFTTLYGHIGKDFLPAPKGRYWMVNAVEQTLITLNDLRTYIRIHCGEAVFGLHAFDTPHTTETE